MGGDFGVAQNGVVDGDFVDLARQMAINAAAKTRGGVNGGAGRGESRADERSVEINARRLVGLGHDDVGKSGTDGPLINRHRRQVTVALLIDRDALRADRDSQTSVRTF